MKNHLFLLQMLSIIAIFASALSIDSATITLDDITAEDADIIRGIKKFDNAVIRNQLSSGELFVAGDAIVNHNLNVNNNETVEGDLTVKGNIIFTGSLTTSELNSPLTLIGNPGACLIFENQAGAELVRLCSPNDGTKGIYASVNGGITQNIRIDTAGNTIIDGIPVISVTTYGAVGDGITDNYQAIVNTMLAAQHMQSNVWFPAGTYAVGQSLPMYDNVVLYGENKLKCTLKALGNFPVIKELRTITTPLLNAGVVNMTIRGSGKNNANAHGIQLLFTNRVFLYDIFIFSCNHGVDLAHSWQLAMTNVHVHGAGTDQSNIGFYFQPLTDPGDENNAACALNCVAQGIADTGFRLVNSNGSKFASCEAMDGNYGFYLGDPAPATPQRQVRWSHFANCLGDTNAIANWYLIRGLAPYMGQMELANCWGGNSGGPNMVLSGCSNMSLTGILLVNAQQSGMELINTSSHLSITGCTIQNYNQANAGFAGINVADSNYCTITGNNTQTDTGNMRGIDLNGTSNGNVISSNIVQNAVGNFSSGTNVIANNVTF